MLDPRVRRALTEYHQGKRSLEETAQLLVTVRRESGCLELYPSPSAGAADRALLARYAELLEDPGGAGANS